MHKLVHNAESQAQDQSAASWVQATFREYILGGLSEIPEQLREPVEKLAAGVPTEEERQDLIAEAQLGGIKTVETYEHIMQRYFEVHALEYERPRVDIRYALENPETDGKDGPIESYTLALHELDQFISRRRQDLKDAMMFAMQYVLDETISNHVKHGNLCDSRKKVVIHTGLRQENGLFVVETQDDGLGYDHDSQMAFDPTHPDALEVPNYRGHLLSTVYAEEFEIVPPGNKSYMTFGWSKVMHRLMDKRKTPEDRHKFIYGEDT